MSDLPRVWTDFNAYSRGRRYGAVQLPQVHVGGRVLLYDDEGNTCEATVTGLRSAVVWVEQDDATWKAAQDD